MEPLLNQHIEHCDIQHVSSSLIICSRNRADMLIATIESILQGNDVPTELIIIDQSDVAHASLAAWKSERCEIRYIRSQTVGLSRANNLGTAAARYDLLAFTHDDVIVTPTWFGTLIQALVTAGPQAIVTGRVLPSAPEMPGGFAPTLKVDDEPAKYEGRVGIDVLKPLNMAMYRSALEKVGGFDERLGPGTPFPGAEDSDLGFRLLEAGYRVIYVPEAILYHRAWRTDQEYLPLRWRYGVAQGAFFAKHLKLHDLYMLRRMLIDHKRRARRFPRRMWYERRRALGDPLFIIGNLVGAFQWFRTHRRAR